MISRERGLKGIILFIIFYLPIIDFMEKMGLHELLGRNTMWFLFSCNYINIPCGMFWVFFFFFFTHPLIVMGSLVLIHSLLHPPYSC
jgi:hypothetical protein